MPTVLLLDVSLSMTRPVRMTDGTEEYQRRHLAVHGINTLLDHIASSCKLEFVSLITYSHKCDVIVPFTRDGDTIKSALNKVEAQSRTCLEYALTGASTAVVDEWSTTVATQIIIVTDGSSGFGPGSLKHCLHNAHQRDSTDAHFPLPFPFPSKLIVVCLANPSDPDLQSSLPLYQKLIELNSDSGEVIVPDGHLSLKSVQQAFQTLGDTNFSPYYGNVKCGHLQCDVLMFPRLEEHDSVRDFQHVHSTLFSTFEICGFLDISDISNPPILSRHLVLSVSTKDKAKTEDGGNGDDKKEPEEEGDGKTPSFTVLLHGSLKVEGMVALVHVGDNWYGMLYSWADSKKKSNLMISLFEPGDKALSWIGSFNNLSSIMEFAESPYGDDDTKTPFPVRPSDKRSYAQSCIVWIKPTGLQADLQKVIRHARKLPDKQQQFYKELNRIRRAALSLGFLELLDALAEMLERECTMLPGTAHPGAAMQLTHAANALRKEMARDVSQTIMPMRTNFSNDD